MRSSVGGLDNLLERLEIFHDVVLLLIGQSQIESLVVAVNRIEQRLESAIVVEAPFVLESMNRPFSRTKIPARFIVRYA